MEKPNTPYNYHLDKTVLLFFMITFLAFGSLFAYKLVTKEDCGIVNFKIHGNKYKVGELIRFTDYTEGAEKWKWDFNDSTELRTERNPYHTFSKPGKYDIRLTVNKGCEVTKTITIEEKEFVLDSTKLPIFEIPTQTMVGQEIKVEDNTPRANTWEWRFGETATVNSYEKEAKYTYKESGLKTISLVINGELKHIGKQKIKVLPQPKKKEDIGFVKSNDELDSDIKMSPDIGVDDKDEKKIEKAPYIGPKEFGAKLVKVADKKENFQIFAPYMCNNLKMSVVVNKKKQDFDVFCQKIRGRTITVKDVEIVRDKETNCITNVIIDVSKGWF
ncbi:PKD domain-containing protein [Aequorivita capsosiphonis]|uniref:PKD domain-containing protein n=1 Tax=Aequorivita capsosiphonis TaxID=487317 RepID=UPI000404E905|nr:PKD domain-containing protein [Aequorivita capsosiphonis]